MAPAGIEWDYTDSQQASYQVVDYLDDASDESSRTIFRMLYPGTITEAWQSAVFKQLREGVNDPKGRGANPFRKAIRIRLKDEKSRNEIVQACQKHLKELLQRNTRIAVYLEKMGETAREQSVYQHIPLVKAAVDRELYDLSEAFLQQKENEKLRILQEHIIEHRDVFLDDRRWIRSGGQNKEFGIFLEKDPLKILVLFLLYALFSGEDDDVGTFQAINEAVFEREYLVYASERVFLKNITANLQTISRYQWEKMAAEEGRAAELDPELFSYGTTEPGDTSEDLRPLQDYLNTTNVSYLLLGEGGIGKTSILLSCLDRYHTRDKRHGKQDPSIPIYLSLAKCVMGENPETIVRQQILHIMQEALSEIERFGLKDLMEFFDKTPGKNGPAVTLLCDGLNEISLKQGTELKEYIVEELQMLLGMPNLRLIVTSRGGDDDSDGFMYGLNVEGDRSISKVYVKGIREETVQAYLEKHLSDPGRVRQAMEHRELRKILRVPLFLKMFASAAEQTKQLPLTRGAILYQYFNGMQNGYTEKRNLSDKLRSEEQGLITFLLDNLLPGVGHYMVSEDLLQISWDELEQVKKQVEKEALKYEGVRKLFYETEKERPNAFRMTLSRYRQTETDQILLWICDHLHVMVEHRDGALLFAHQYIRDYFDALYLIVDIYRITTLDGNDAFDAISSLAWDSTTWSSGRMEIMSEVLDGLCGGRVEHPKEDPVYQAVDKFRGSYQRPDGTKEDGEIISAHLGKLLRFLSYRYEGDLSWAVLDRLDLRNTFLYDVNFENPFTGKIASFADSISGRNTFSTNAHYFPIEQIAMSDHRHFLVTLTDRYYPQTAWTEIKLWDIKSAGCVYSSKIRLNDLFDDYFRYNAEQILYYEELHAVVLNFASVRGVSIAMTLVCNTETGERRCYSFERDLPEEEILFFLYDEIRDEFVAISRKCLFFYPRTGEQRYEKEISFSKEVFSFPNYDHIIHIQLRDQVFFLAQDQVLFCIEKQYFYRDRNGLYCAQMEYTLLDLKTRDCRILYRPTEDVDCGTVSGWKERSLRCMDIVPQYQMAVSPNHENIAFKGGDSVYLFSVSEKKLQKIYDAEEVGVSFLSFDRSNDVLAIYHPKEILFYHLKRRVMQRRPLMQNLRFLAAGHVFWDMVFDEVVSVGGLNGNGVYDFFISDDIPFHGKNYYNPQEHKLDVWFGERAFLQLDSDGLSLKKAYLWNQGEGDSRFAHSPDGRFFLSIGAHSDSICLKNMYDGSTWELDVKAYGGCDRFLACSKEYAVAGSGWNCFYLVDLKRRKVLMPSLDRSVGRESIYHVEIKEHQLTVIRLRYSLKVEFMENYEIHGNQILLKAEKPLAVIEFEQLLASGAQWLFAKAFGEKYRSPFGRLYYLRLKDVPDRQQVIEAVGEDTFREAEKGWCLVNKKRRLADHDQICCREAVFWNDHFAVFCEGNGLCLYCYETAETILLDENVICSEDKYMDTFVLDYDEVDEMMYIMKAHRILKYHVRSGAIVAQSQELDPHFQAGLCDFSGAFSVTDS
ncbi:MAG: hypothetical protein K5697_08985 [Lachnospiraceae bacterium]|nr:hypothetical protein [Lachnospiraceae bacterium]